jgi:hypothetical protein
MEDSTPWAKVTIPACKQSLNLLFVLTCVVALDSAAIRTSDPNRANLVAIIHVVKCARTFFDVMRHMLKSSCEVISSMTAWE